MKYQIVETLDHRSLARQVEQHLAAGWTCQGGVSVTSVREKLYTYTQAMVLNEVAEVVSGAEERGAFVRANQKKLNQALELARCYPPALRAFSLDATVRDQAHRMELLSSLDVEARRVRAGATDEYLLTQIAELRWVIENMPAER